MKKRDTLFFGTLFYLLLPNLLFLTAWLRPGLGWSLAGLLLLVAWLQYRLNQPPTLLNRLSQRGRAGMLLLAFFYCVLAGIGEIGRQKSDYDKHNLMVHDLIQLNQPIVYDNDNYNDPLLCYYIGYYLPTAFAAKLTGGLAVARWWSMAWGGLGLYLIFNWLHRLHHPYGWWAAGLFFIVGGLDVLIHTFWVWQYWFDGSVSRLFKEYFFEKAQGFKFYIPPHVTLTNELTENRLDMPAPFTQLQWAPQHALGGWLSAALVMCQILEYRTSRLIVLVAALTLLWSPFVTIGLLPFLVWAFIKLGWQNFVSSANLVGGLIGLTVTAYYLAHLPQQYFSLLFIHFQNVRDLALYLVFMTGHVGVCGLILYFLKKRKVLSTERIQLAWCAIIGVILFSLVCMGKYNDFLMRTILPAQWVLLPTLAFGLAELWRRRQWRSLGILGVCLLIGAYYPLRETAISLWNLSRPPQIKRSIVRAVSNFGEADVSRISRDSTAPGTDFAAQYLGRRDSFFGRYLMKQPVP